MPYALTSRPVAIRSIGREVGTGWNPPSIDRRDYTEHSDRIKPALNRLNDQLKAHKSKALQAPPSSIDLRAYCSPIEDQLHLGSCTANAAVGVVEYYERRAFGKHIDGSRLFVYKTTRNLLGLTGDTGAWLRNTMGALVSCGVPPERYWPYTDDTPEFDREPPAFIYAVADDCAALQYFAHDPLSKNVARPDVVASVKKYLAAGLPSMFGFWGYGSFDSGDAPGHIPLPTEKELAGDP